MAARGSLPNDPPRAVVGLPAGEVVLPGGQIDPRAPVEDLRVDPLQDRDAPAAAGAGAQALAHEGDHPRLLAAAEGLDLPAPHVEADADLGVAGVVRVGGRLGQGLVAHGGSLTAPARVPPCATPPSRTSASASY